MTNQEAIEELKSRKEHYEMGDGCEFLVEALDKAIEALELQSSLINELKDLKEKTESYLKTINDELDWFGGDKE